MDIIRFLIENGGKRKSNDDDRDRISKLPHDILISIFSRLTLREAIATRILSSRWRYFCINKYATHLSFPPFHLSDFYDSYEVIHIRRFRNYINMINQILDSHRNPKVKEFRVRMLSLGGATIQKWLFFALSKQAEIIDIHMDYMKGALCVAYSLRLFMHLLPLGYESLKKLYLSSIVVEDSDIEHLLFNSPQLESLSVAWPKMLTKVSVVGLPTYMLKHLEICHALDLKLVEICNMTNLVSLKLHYLAPDYAFGLSLNNVPKLVEFSTSALKSVFSKVAPSIWSQLRILKICSSAFDMHSIMFGEMLPKFKRVKHLELQYEPFSVYDMWLWPFLKVIQRCPFILEELTIKLSWEVNTNYQEKDARTISCIPKGDLFPSLRKIKFSGFVGYSTELNVIISILNNANSLEELTVEVCDVTEEIRLRGTARALQHIRPTIQDSTRLQVI